MRESLRAAGLAESVIHHAAPPTTSPRERMEEPEAPPVVIPAPPLPPPLATMPPHLKEVAEPMAAYRPPRSGAVGLRATAVMAVLLTGVLIGILSGQPNGESAPATTRPRVAAGYGPTWDLSDRQPTLPRLHRVSAADFTGVFGESFDDELPRAPSLPERLTEPRAPAAEDPPRTAPPSAEAPKVLPLRPASAARVAASSSSHVAARVSISTSPAVSAAAAGAPRKAPSGDAGRDPARKEEPPDRPKAAPVAAAPAACAGGPSLGTALSWSASPRDAAVLARAHGKLVFLIQVSGNFAIPEFT